MKGRKVSSWVMGVVSLVAVVGAWPLTSWACAVCWGADDALAHGLNVSILFLMSMPFLIGGSIIGIICVAQRRARGQRWPSWSVWNVAWRRKEAEK